MLNDILAGLYAWFCRNMLTPHPGKTEYMLLGLGSLVGPLQEIRLGDNFIDRVKSTRCLGVEVDCRLKWDAHVDSMWLS